MLVDFLESHVPLTKTFTKEDTGYAVSPYPMVREVTSHRCEFSTIEELHRLLQDHAAKGHCLLKGLVRETLITQSRAGSTEPERKTDWLLLDLDFASGWPSVEAFVDELNPEFRDVSFIFQHSSSAGIKHAAGLRGHVWILLDTPVLPSVLKAWLKERNLAMEGLQAHISLSVSGHSLKWPLDITTCQNDKLIYIAPPVCTNFPDPIQDERFVLHRRGKDKAKTPMFTMTSAAINKQQNKTLAQLRMKAKLPELKPKLKTVDGVEVLVNPDEAIVTGVQKARGFTYLNLNGGDSWAYYFPDNRPDLVFNFKGEPAFYLKDVAPEYHKQYVQALRHAAEASAPPDAIRPFVFRDWIRDTYFNAIYDPPRQHLQMAKAASIQRLHHFLQQYEQIPPEIIPDWTVTFDPTTLQNIDFERQWVNTFNPTKYLRDPPEPQTEIPPTINLVLDSITAGDHLAKTHFLNWLAYIFQTRRKTGTAWIFHGVSGTGKGVLVSRILKPLFSSEHVVEYTTSNLEDNFNSLLERAIILWMDEFHIDSARSTGSVMNRLKNLITEDRILLRAMRQDGTQVRNYSNVIIATNHPDPVTLAMHDRRFNVAPPQEKPLRLTAKDIEAVDAEVPLFAGFLRAYQVNEPLVRQIMLNDARENMIIASSPSNTRMLHCLITGDLDFFLGYSQPVGSFSDSMFYGQFEKALIAWCNACLEGKPYPMPIHEMQIVYTYTMSSPIAPAKFRRMLSTHRVNPKWLKGLAEPAQGIDVIWTGDKDRIQQFLNSRKQKPNLSVVVNQ